ncbi:MAG: hypothetical protein B5M56_01450 [Desulfococcus sp. 4484_241]|nr:MAG: hypothetical protein B5M56_01450 [Desulfococcus sp. 4484_241]
METSYQEPGQKQASRRKPRRVAVIAEWCTGCGGAPVCAVYCRQNALRLVDDPDNPPFKIMTVDADRCIGCGACVTGGANGIFLSGCPWGAISLKETRDFNETERAAATL